jgi:hypothetical protein
MDETRRHLIKGILTGGTLLALGIPRITQAAHINQSLFGSTHNCQLLMGATPINEAFAKGAQTACALYSSYRQGILSTFQLEDELLTNPVHIVDLLTQSHNMRWVAVMDDANAAVFTELVRNAEGHLLALGSHTSISSDNIPLSLRHVWTTASPAYSAGGLLASILMQNQHNFSIVENFLAPSRGDSAGKEVDLSEFLSYQLADQAPIRLHCAGVLPLEASQLIGWRASQNWQPIFSQTDGSSTYQDKTASATAIELPQFDNWIEVTGYATVATALGMGIHQELCSRRAFVHRSGQRYPHHHELAGKHFISFVIDV